jgi:hypothetical protein
MRAELVLLGKRIDMSARKRRRKLVIFIYVAIAAVMIDTWFLDRWHGTGAYVLYAAFFACFMFLGGTYSTGLVKPFNNKRPRTYTDPPPFLLLRLRTYLPVPGEGNDYLNDERELHQRGYAHYKAYQIIGLAVALIWALAMFRTLLPAWFRWISMKPDTLYYGLLLVVMVLFLTLPQSILLWTEPDMEPDPEFAKES